MNKVHTFLAVGIAALLVLATTGRILLAEEDDNTFVAPWAYGRPEARGDDVGPAPLREEIVEITEVVHLDILEKVGGAITPRRDDAVTAASGPEAKTLYVHSLLGGDADRLAEFAGAAPGPTMDENAPTTPVSKAQTMGAAGNNNFRKNFLAGYFSGSIHGRVSDVRVILHVQGTTSVEATLFGDGGVGTGAVVARKTVPTSPVGVSELTIDFGATSFNVVEELVVSLRAVTSNQALTAAILHDSTIHPSRVELTLSPLAAAQFDDPAGIAFRGGKTVVLNAGSGVVQELDGNAPPAAIASGYYPAGFTRGLSDAVTDADGNVYFSETDTGKVHFLRPDGTTGVYAKSLGAPTGLAFDALGNLYVGDSSTGDIVKVRPDRVVEPVARLPRAQVFDLALAPNGTLTASTFRPGFVWSVDVGTGAVAQRAFLGANTTAEGLAFDMDGSLWIGSSEANATGRLLRLATDNTLAVSSTTVGGPVHIAFLPGQSALVVATQGELTSLGDAVITVATPAAGLPVAAPALTPTAVSDAWQGWVHAGSGRALPVSAFSGALPVGEMLDVGRDPAEPTLAIQSDGDLFTVAASDLHKRYPMVPLGGAGEPAVMRSQDNGETWEIVSPTLAGVNDPPTTADPFVYVDPDTDRVFSFDLTGACHYLSYSDDSGDSWTTNRLACGVPPVDHQSLISAKPRGTPTMGYPNILYHCTNWVASSPCGRSLDGGDTWSPAGPAFPQNVYDQSSGCLASGGLVGHLGADLEGRVFAGKSRCGVPIVAVSEDDGVTWKVGVLNRTVGIRGHDIDFAVDADNNVYAAWISSAGQLVYVASTDNGKTWGPAHRVSTGGLREAQMPSVAAGAAGALAFTYIGSPSDYGYAAQSTGKWAWNAYVTVTTDALAADPVLATITPHAFSDPITRGACARPCSGIWDFLDTRIGPDGRAWGTSIDACLDACSTDRSGIPLSYANAHIIALAAGPDLRNGGSLAPRA